jgi:hypothetical protein
MIADIATRLEIKADCIESGDRIAWGSDTALMRHAASVIRMQNAIIVVQLDSVRRSIRYCWYSMSVAGAMLLLTVLWSAI